MEDSSASRRILLADADAFFVAVARRVDPEGAGRQRLLLVGGSAKARGVVTSASYETRTYGVRSGMPMAQALRLCPDAMCVPVPMDECRRASRAIRDVLQQFTPDVEPASIDEFYLDLSHTTQLYGDEPLAQTASRIREVVRDGTGFSVSIGGGTSRLIAKLAARRAKPHASRLGVFVVPPGGEAAFLEEHELAAIPMVGPKFQERLARHGLRTVRDALVIDRDRLSRWLGDRAGDWLYERIRGRDTTPIEPRLPAKSMGHEETFAVDLANNDDLERELVRLATRVAADLRAKELVGRTITVKLRDADFTTRQASRTLPEAVAADRPILATAHTLLRQLRTARQVPARLLGVTVSQLARQAQRGRQLSLFSGDQQTGEETAHDRKLAHAVDQISKKYGRGHIVRGSEVREE